MAEHDSRIRRGRGATLNPAGRFAAQTTQRDAAEDEAPESMVTEVRIERAKSIITRNQSPDIPFEQSVNMYRGCEHGCVYCYARPSHAYVDLSPGVDFETILFQKANAPELLRNELAKPGYRCKLINLGANTDPYQPIEKRYRLTRQILEILLEFRHPVSIITKGSLIRRDLDLLAELASHNLVSVAVSLTTLDAELKRILEPRAASGKTRLDVMRELHANGVPVTALIAPVIPFITDNELEKLLAAAKDAGAGQAAYIFLRLPHEVAPLFEDWLKSHYPDRAAHVMSLIRQSRGGKDNSWEFGERMRGTGQYAELLRKRFHIACRKLGLNRRESVALDTAQFRAPHAAGQQDLFGE